MKICCHCKQSLEFEKFSNDKSSKDGKRASCRLCRKELRDKSFSKERQKQYDLKHRLENPEKFLWKWAKKRAKKNGLEFSIQIDDIRIPAKCPILGIPLTLSKNGTSFSSPSLDRIDNFKGYTKNNIMVCSFRANSIKNNSSYEELEGYLENFLSYIKARKNQ